MSAKKKTSAAPAENLALYDKLIGTNPKIERKGATMPYTSVNGNMFTLLDPSGTLALRLAEAEREKFLKKHKTRLFEAYGCDEGIRGGPRRTAQEHPRVAEIS